jgi:hypothetical protein
MPEADAKTRALLDEGLTQGEIDYLQSGGKNSDGLTPPAAGDDAAKPAPAEPEKPAQAAEPAKPAPAEAASATPAEPVEEDDEPAKDSPFYPQWKREKTRRQELQRELQARETSIAAERASTAAEREKWARLDERLKVFQQAVEPPAQQPAAPPDPEADPFGYMRWLGEQVNGLAGKTDQVATNVQERDAATELQTTYVRDAREFATRQADFGQAYNWLMANRDAELSAAGYTDPAERMRIITLDERDIVARALMARQTNPNAAGPAQIIYGLARARGFQAPAPAAPLPSGSAGHTGNGAAASSPAPAAAPPTVTQQVEAIQRGQAASRSLSSAGGAPAPAGIDLAKLADMDDNEYAAWRSSLTAAQRKEFTSLIGAPGR